MQIARVGIVEDDSATRGAWTSAISGSTDVRVEASFGSAEAALAGLSKWLVDLWLVDFSLPGMSGVEFIRRARFVNPDFDFIVVTLNDNPEDILSAIKAGATGYLIKPFSCPQLLAAVRESRMGGAPMAPAVARLVLKTFRQSQPGLPPGANLSTRELELLMAMTGGSTNHQIAEELSLSERTVATHLHNIYRKLHVRNRTQAVALMAGVPFHPPSGHANANTPSQPPQP